MNMFRGAVRPLVTFAFVLAQIGVAIGWMAGMGAAEPAFAALSPFTMLIVRDYFEDRKRAEQ